MTKKRLFVVSGAVLVAAVGITAGLIFTTRANPEDRLYAAMSGDGFDTVSVEESVGNDTTKINAKGIVKKDGSMKMTGEFACKAPTLFGDLDINIGVKQVNSEVFLQFNTISVASDESPEVAQQVNDLFSQTLAGKSVLVDDADVTAASLKKYGTIFSLGGVGSTKISSEKITEELKKHKVMTIVNTTNATVDGKAATEYSVVIRRSAYEKFVDALIPKYEYKQEVIDLMFDDDTEEVSVTIDKKTGEVIASSYSMENPCADIIGQFDPNATTELPKTVRIESKTTNDKDVKEATRPAEYLTPEEFGALLSGEE